MAFGFPNPFGGNSSSDKDRESKSQSQQSSSETSSSTPSNTPLFGSPNPSHALTSSSSASSSEIKQKLTTAITTQSNVANAKALISKINENCFDHCIPSPGSSLSGKEQSCLSACMEKYIEGWNVVSRSYVARLQREGAQIAGAGAGSNANQGGLF